MKFIIKPLRMSF